MMVDLIGTICTICNLKKPNQKREEKEIFKTCRRRAPWLERPQVPPQGRFLRNAGQPAGFQPVCQIGSFNDGRKKMGEKLMTKY